MKWSKEKYDRFMGTFNLKQEAEEGSKISPGWHKVTISNFEFFESSKKKTPYVRFFITFENGEELTEM